MLYHFTLFLLITVYLIHSSCEYQDDSFMHPHLVLPKTIAKRSIDDYEDDYPDESSREYWFEQGQDTIKEKLKRKPNEKVAKNVILFLGDGMSIPTLAATRAYMGGEEKSLSFEKFPYTGLSKTYCVDTQVPDSACTATAYLCGVKANYGTIGVDASIKRQDCEGMTKSEHFAYSIAHEFQNKGRMTGLVTTARVTHASPAGVFAHTSERDWESDHEIITSKKDPNVCKDIASQLVFGETGRRLNVILGGGRTNFIPTAEVDEDSNPGKRHDGKNLIKKWVSMKQSEGKSASYVSNRDELLDVDHATTDYLLGLFNEDHITYNMKRDPAKEPSLKEMTRAAIEMLSKSENGYFLFVEGARIDMAHHEAKAQIALNETTEFSDAIQEALDMTNHDETLIVVTSDHAHTMSYAGYAPRGSDILGIAGEAADGLPYLTLTYANGPGYKTSYFGKRYDVTHDNMFHMDYQYPGNAPIEMETHGGDDVGIFATGPWAHLFTGVIEENVIAQLMAFAGCVGKGVQSCDNSRKP